MRTISAILKKIYDEVKEKMIDLSSMRTKRKKKRISYESLVEAVSWKSLSNIEEN